MARIVKKLLASSLPWQMPERNSTFKKRITLVIFISCWQPQSSEGASLFFSKRGILTFRNVGLGGGEGLLDDEGLAAAHQVLGDHPEVVGGVFFQAPDLDGGEAGGADLRKNDGTKKELDAALGHARYSHRLDSGYVYEVESMVAVAAP
jgi:hypothetical protein